MIEVKNIKYKYPDEEDWVLKGITFSLKQGEKTVLMGANGSGKTTFVRCLNGLIHPQTGEVYVDGLSTSVTEHLYEIRRTVGMVFQNPDNQIVSTTVEREIAFGLENIGIDQLEMRDRVEQALEKFKLRKYRRNSPHLLSGGEKQSLAFASVWVMNPDYLILDETTSMLDHDGKRKVLEFLDEACKLRRIGILLVTQSPEEAVNFDRLIIMNNGKIVLDGHPDDIFLKIDELKRMSISVPVEFELSDFLSRSI